MNKGKSLIFCSQGAIESPMSFKELTKAIKEGTGIKGFFSINNQETGRPDKYLCDVELVGEISHIVNLEGECIIDSKKEMEKEIAQMEKAKLEEDKTD